uniref:Uncharacterized protein n=2 Tax=viral metagenome TaxID=1070528 RepID=A0A6M3LXS5_9ZZZZ
MADLMPLDDGTFVVNVMSNEPVIINKLYGPAVFADVRVTAIIGSDWVWLFEQHVEDDACGLSGHWQEVGRIPCIHEDDKGLPNGGVEENG